MSDSRTVLFELGTEELPPALLRSFWSDLSRSAVRGLADAGLVGPELQPESLPGLYAARRLALEIPDVRSETKSESGTRRGPAVKVAFDERGEPTKALLGFARSCGAKEDQVERWRAGEDCLETDKGAWVTIEQVKPARPVQEVMPEIMRQVVADMFLDVRMRWGAGDEEFARPVRWVVFLYGDEVVSGSLMGLEFGRESRGHRFLNSRLVCVDKAESYRDRLRENGVLALWKDRHESLTEQFQAIESSLSQKYGGEVHVAVREIHGATTANWAKNLSSAEWPKAVMGEFDKRFLLLPREVVTTVLEDQQQYFPVQTSDDRAGAGIMLPHFVAVANLPDKKGHIRMGCERVVQARLQDAEFYWQQDRQRRLEDRVADLERVVFHQKLGTLAERTQRIEVLAGFVAEQIGANKDSAMRAARLCKADLTTDMVQAFPRLQGVMGGHYARADGEDEIVCSAIAMQYWHKPQRVELVPNFSGPGLALALAERLDMLIGVFAVGEIPTGTRDPLGVRRATYDVVYLMLACERVKDLSISEIDSMLERAAAGYQESLNAREAISPVRAYLTDRLRSNAVGGNDPYAHDEVEAVLAVPWRNPSHVFQRLEVLRGFRQTTGGATLAEANKRIRNILRKTEAPDGALDAELLCEPAEQALAERVAALRPEVEQLCRERQYQQAMERLATLAEPVAKFFDDVLVMAEEPEIRHNRLRLLRDVRELFLTIADLSRLQGAAKEA